MVVSVILGHPRPGSFNHAIAETAVRVLLGNGHEVRFHDLYAEGFDPVLPFGEIAKGAPAEGAVEEHCGELSSADGIVVVHPNWWGQPPALLKGWVDRVFRAGVAYEFAEGDNGAGLPIGLLKAQAALVLNTSNTPADREREVFGDPLETLWKNCLFEFCGVNTFFRKTYCPIAGSHREQRALWLKDVEETVDGCFPTG